MGARHRCALQRLATALAATALAAAGAAANAEVYRCVGPDGQMRFTDDPSACPGARKHDSPAKLQTVSTPAADSAPPLDAMDGAAAEAAIDHDRAHKRLWQQKKRIAEEKLRVLVDREAKLEPAVTGCNRGAEIISRDDAGLKYRVSCDEIRAQHAEVRDEAEELRRYLDEGLQRECREAGCLPGWIR